MLKRRRSIEGGHTAQVRLRYGGDTEEVGFDVSSVMFKVGGVHEFTGLQVNE
jgi:hypothetical protein